MSKLSYQDSMRDPMVVTNPNTTGLKAPGELLEISAGFITFYSPTKQANPTIKIHNKNKEGLNSVIWRSIEADVIC